MGQIIRTPASVCVCVSACLSVIEFDKTLHGRLGLKAKTWVNGSSNVRFVSLMYNPILMKFCAAKAKLIGTETKNIYQNLKFLKSRCRKDIIIL